MNKYSVSFWKLVKTVLRKKRHYFVIAPFITYVEEVKKTDIDRVLTEDPSKFYSIVLEYFRGDKEAAYFFIDYIVSCLMPGEPELKDELIRYMKTGDNVQAKEILESVLSKARRETNI